MHAASRILNNLKPISFKLVLTKGIFQLLKKISFFLLNLCKYRNYRWLFDVKQNKKQPEQHNTGAFCKISSRRIKHMCGKQLTSAA